MKPRGGALLLAAAALAVGAAVVAGFFALGSPTDERIRRLDRRRVEDLQAIAAAVQEVYQRRQGSGLPDSLSAVDARRYGKGSSRDPVTGEPYGYRVTGPGRFQLCATFQTEVRDEDFENWERIWSHASGRACFDFDLVNANLPLTPLRPSTSAASPPTPLSGAR